MFSRRSDGLLHFSSRKNRQVAFLVLAIDDNFDHNSVLPMAVILPWEGIRGMDVLPYHWPSRGAMSGIKLWLVEQDDTPHCKVFLRFISGTDSDFVAGICKIAFFIGP